LALDVCADYGINPDTEWPYMDKQIKAEMIEKRRIDIDYENRRAEKQGG